MKLAEIFLSIVTDALQYLKIQDVYVKDRLIDELDKSFSFIHTLSPEVEAPYTRAYIDLVVDDSPHNLIALLEADEPCLQGVPENLHKWKQQYIAKLAKTYQHWRNNIAQGQLRLYLVVSFNSTGLLSSLRMSSYNPLPYQRIQGSDYDTSIARSLDDARKIVKYYWQAQYKLPTADTDKNLEAWAIEWGSSLMAQFSGKPVTGESFSFAFTILFFISTLRKFSEQNLLEVYHRENHKRIEPDQLVLPNNIVASGAFLRDQIPDESLTPKEYKNICSEKVAHVQIKLDTISQANSVCETPFIEYFLIPKDNYFDITEQHKNIIVVPVDDLDDLIIKFFPHWFIRSKNQVSEKPKVYIDIKHFLQQAQQLIEQLAEIHQQNKIYKHLTLNCISSTLGSSSITLIDPREAMSIALVNPESTAAYISPEQSDYYVSNIDHRTDFYSLGIVFYQMLTTKLPFDYSNVRELITAHISQKVIPPHDLFPQIPLSLSNIIMKMLAKKPDDRYKSAAGIANDLKAYGKEEESDFLFDAYETFVLPKKIYGREIECVQLEKCWTNFLNGNNQIVMVYGMPGVGKTSFVNNLLPNILKEKGIFLSGKYHQNNAVYSHNALIQMVQKFCGQVLSNSPDFINKWRNQILDKLEANIRVVAESIPGIEHLVGKQQQPSALPPEESRNRFYLAMEQLVEVIITNNHKTVLFIDDIQWMEEASFLFIEKILGKYPEQFFLIFSSRNNESNCEKTMRLKKMITTKELGICELSLHPLPLTAVEEIINHLFSPTQSNIKRLSSLVFQRTMGNPLFIKQFIQMIWQNNLICFAKDTRTWSWQINLIEQLDFGNDIVNSLQKKMRQLPDEYQEILDVCACFYDSFSIEILCYILPQYNHCIADFIHYVMQQNYITSQSQWSSSSIEQKYRFTHDLIHQSAYASIGCDKKAQIHHKIGTYYFNLKMHNIPPINIISHWNCCVSLLKEEEKLQLADLNFQAAIRAKNATTYERSIVYIQHIKTLSQQINLKQKFISQVQQQEAELAYLSKDFEKAEKLFLQMIHSTNDKVEIARIHVYLVILYTHLGDWDRSFETGKKGLGYLGISWSSKNLVVILLKELYMIKAKLRKLKAKPDYFLSIPELQNETQKTALQLLSIFMNTTYYGGKVYALLTALKMVNITLEKGFSVDSSNGYGYFAMLLGHIKFLGNYELGHKIMESAIELSNLYDNPLYKGRVYFTFGAVVNHWTQSLESNLSYLQKAQKYSLQGGDVIFASYATVHPLQIYFFSGKNLNELFEETNAVLDFLDRVSFTPQEFFALGLQTFIVHFTDVCSTEIRKKICADHYINEQKQIKNITGIIWLKTLELKQFYLENDYEKALDIAITSLPYLNGAFGQIMESEYYYYYTLSLLALYPRKKKCSFVSKKIKKYFCKLVTWKNNCPQNFQHKYLIVKSEIHRVQHDFLSAMKFYQEAINEAQKTGFIHQQALASELAAKMYLQLDIHHVAEMYIKQSIDCYQKWGATKKVQQLQTLLSQKGE